MSSYNYELVSVFERCNVICVCMFKHIFNRIKHVDWCIHYVFWCIVCPVISWTLARWNIIQFTDGCSKEEVVDKMEHPNIIRVQAPLSKMRRGIVGVMKVSEIQGLYSLSGKTSYRKISWRREIDCYIDSIAMTFERHLGSAAAEVPLKFQSDWNCLNPNLAASGDIAVRRLTAWRIETQRLDLNTLICVQNYDPYTMKTIVTLAEQFCILIIIGWYIFCSIIAGAALHCGWLWRDSRVGKVATPLKTSLLNPMTSRSRSRYVTIIWAKCLSVRLISCCVGLQSVLGVRICH